MAFGVEGETTEFLYNGDGLLWKKKDARGLVAVESTYYGAGSDEGKVETETHYVRLSSTYQTKNPGQVMAVRRLIIAAIRAPSIPSGHGLPLERGRYR